MLEVLRPMLGARRLQLAECTYGASDGSSPIFAQIKFEVEVHRDDASRKRALTCAAAGTT